jgi:hypothetical protein
MFSLFRHTSRQLRRYLRRSKPLQLYCLHSKPSQVTSRPGEQSPDSKDKALQTTKSLTIHFNPFRPLKDNPNSIPSNPNPNPKAKMTTTTTTTTTAPTAPKSLFPDGLKTSGQHNPTYDLLTPPSLFPKEISGPTVWKAEDYRDHPERWTHVFSASEVEELGRAADDFIESGRPLTGMAKVRGLELLFDSLGRWFRSKVIPC